MADTKVGKNAKNFVVYSPINLNPGDVLCDEQTRKPLYTVQEKDSITSKYTLKTHNGKECLFMKNVFTVKELVDNKNVIENIRTVITTSFAITLLNS